MCGIKVNEENMFTIAPCPGGHFTYAKSSYMSVYGEVKSSWKRDNGSTVYTITVPSNTSAKVILPDGSDRIQMPGTAEYILKD